MKDFILFAYDMARRKQDAGKNKTANNYRCATRALERFLFYEGRTQVLPFSDFTAAYVERFETFLRHRCHVARNTSSSYLRSLKTVWNSAVREGHAPAHAMPFANVYTGVDKTIHRAAPAAIIRRLMDATLPRDSSQAFTRDLFLFSFFARGMAFVDMAHLRKSDLRQGHLCYVRSKTGQPICVAVTEAMTDIIRRWNVAESEYLLPILTEPSSHRTYETALHRYNLNLRRLSRRLGLMEHLTSYTARHTWASEAYRLQVPVSVISSCMGHTTETTTRIYLRSLDTGYIDAQASIVEKHFCMKH